VSVVADRVEANPEGAPAQRRDNALPILVGATVGLLPLVTPAGPGNTALADAGMVACVAVAVLWAARERLALSFPYAIGVTLLMIGGALAATVAAAPLGTVLVLAQDAFLLMWAAVLMLGRHDPAIIRAATTSWCRVAVVYSGLVVIAYIIGFGPLSGVNAADGVRASYTFGDPNLAGNYLVTSLFMCIACRCPRADSTRRLGYVLILVAIGFTGSNGAVLTLLVGCGVSVAISQYRNRGAYAGLLSLVLAAVVSAALSVAVLPRIDFDAIRAQASSSVPLLRDSVGRSGASSSERRTILSEGVALFLEGNGTGVGPARTKSTLRATQASYVKEAHNDILATVLERGVLGALGLLLLAAAVFSRCRMLLSGRLPPPYDDIVPRAWLLVAVAPVMAMASGFYEVLHFRHLWTWLGIVAALAAVLHEQTARRREDAS
jgi:hypothetical protein